jgi:hypothetical protein
VAHAAQATVGEIIDAAKKAAAAKTDVGQSWADLSNAMAGSLPYSLKGVREAASRMHGAVK